MAKRFDEITRKLEEQARQSRPKLPRHAILYILRGQIERAHRDNIFRQMVRLSPRIDSAEDVLRLPIRSIESFCNRSVPIYIYHHDSVSLWDKQLLIAVLHNYVYRTWFRPYRSEIGCNQFLAQTIHVLPPPFPEGPADAARFAASMTRAICTHVEATQQKIGDRGHRITPYAEMRALGEELGVSPGSDTIHEQKFLLLQPLFRAVAIMLDDTTYNVNVPDIAQITVLLVLTGVEEGLSAPIRFEPIAQSISAYHEVDGSIQAVTTSLATALEFVMDLEKRELAAFGPRPNPLETCKDARTSLLLHKEMYLSLAKLHGWEEDDAPEGPSSRWADLDIYPHWSGGGAEFNERSAQTWERQCRRTAEESPELIPL